MVQRTTPRIYCLYSNDWKQYCLHEALAKSLKKLQVFKLSITSF
jgi:hypothetical protein